MFTLQKSILTKLESMSNSQAYDKQEQDNKETQITLTNYDKIRIIDNVLKDFSNKQINITPLQVSISYQPMKKDNRSNSYDTLYQYYIPGSRYNYKSKHSNLISKLQQLKEQYYQEKQKQKKKQNESKGQSSQSSAGDVEDQKVNLKNESNFRYFKDNVLCFKCNKPGHFKAVCPQVVSCLYCFSQEHQSESCPQKKVCYRCYGFGHMIANCNQRESKPRCHNCQKYHDGGCYFLLTKIKDGPKKRAYYDPIYADKQIRCIKCLKYGHMECCSNQDFQ